MSFVAFRSLLLSVRLMLTVAITLAWVGGLCQLLFQQIMGYDGMYYLVPQTVLATALLQHAAHCQLSAHYLCYVLPVSQVILSKTGQVPICTAPVVVGLTIDYGVATTTSPNALSGFIADLFLISRIREQRLKGYNTRDSVVSGLGMTGGSMHVQI